MMSEFERGLFLTDKNVLNVGDPGRSHVRTANVLNNMYEAWEEGPAAFEELRSSQAERAAEEEEKDMTAADSALTKALGVPVAPRKQPEVEEEEGPQNEDEEEEGDFNPISGRWEGPPRRGRGRGGRAGGGDRGRGRGGRGFGRDRFDDDDDFDGEVEVLRAPAPRDTVLRPSGAAAERQMELETDTVEEEEEEDSAELPKAERIARLKRRREQLVQRQADKEGRRTH